MFAAEFETFGGFQQGLHHVLGHIATEDFADELIAVLQFAAFRQQFLFCDGFSTSTTSLSGAKGLDK